MAEPGYKYLKTYQLFTVIYDLTIQFCEKFLPGRDFVRLREQMIQAARSNKQNIAEGFLEKSLKSYIKLLGVAIASLEELLEDYRDFLRQRNLSLWGKDNPKILAFREFRVLWDFQKSPNSPNTPKLATNPEEAANFILTIGHQQSFLLDRQIKSLEEKFIKEGGYTEKLFRSRINYRK